MTAKGRSFVRIHDAILTDPKIGRLLTAGRFDAVVLYIGLICHSHAHATDGVMSSEDVRIVCRTSAIPRETRALEALRAVGLVSNLRQNVVKIVAYERWQTTSDQRESHAERIRKGRARAAYRAPLEREIERKKDARARDEPILFSDAAGSWAERLDRNGNR